MHHFKKLEGHYLAKYATMVSNWPTWLFPKVDMRYFAVRAF